MRQALVIMAVTMLHQLVLVVLFFTTFGNCFGSRPKPAICSLLENVALVLLFPYSLLDGGDSEYYWFAYLFNSLLWGTCAGFFYLLYARQRSATNIIVPVNFIVPALAVTIAVLGLSAFVGRQEPSATYAVERKSLPRPASSLLTTDLNAPSSCKQRNRLAMKRLQLSHEICDELRADCGSRCFRPVAEEWPPGCKVLVKKNVCIPNG
jgi:hypothetical protein